MSSLVLYKDSYDNNMDPQALAALDGLNHLLMQSELQVSEEIKRTNEISQQTFQQMKGQFAALLEENRNLREQLDQAGSRQYQRKTTHQREIEAWREKSELAQKSLENLRQEMAISMQQVQAEQKAAIQAKEKAVKLAVETADARVNAIKQQIKANLGGVYLHGHLFDQGDIRSMGHGILPHCHCHKRLDPNNYFYSIYSPTNKKFFSKDQEIDYDGEYKTRKALAAVLENQIEAMKKIGS